MAVDEGADLLLADGRVAALAGFAADSGAPGYSDFAESLRGAAIRLTPLQAKPDRWRRISATAALAGSQTTAPGLAETMIAAGLGRFRPDAAAKPCRDRLLAAEISARRARRGLWGGSGAGPLDANDAAAVLKAPKGFVVVEGRILTIGEARGRLYLNFGPRRTTDFSIVISKRHLALLEKAGLTPRLLAGRRLRARGLVDRGFGPQMEIVSPDALELLENESDTADMKR
ncbi:MAG: thermonuclease family protein [Rhodoblastus sp.]